MPACTSGIYPWIFIFRRCVVRHLQYLLLLASQLCPHWTTWGSVCALHTHNVLWYPEYHIYSPMGYIHFLGVLPLLGIFYRGTNFSRLLVHLYSEVYILLIWRCIWLALNVCSLIFGFTWSYCKNYQPDSRLVAVILCVEEESMKVRPSAGFVLVRILLTFDGYPCNS